METFFYVYRKTNNNSLAPMVGVTIPSVKHATISEAITEAERLAAKHPGDSFEVLQCVAISQIPAPKPTTIYLSSKTDMVDKSPKCHPYKVSPCDQGEF
jgi:hypothetical protein